jgi:hypothetical protein
VILGPHILEDLLCNIGEGCGLFHDLKCSDPNNQLDISCLVKEVNLGFGLQRHLKGNLDFWDGHTLGLVDVCTCLSGGCTLGLPEVCSYF